MDVKYPAHRKDSFNQNHVWSRPSVARPVRPAPQGPAREAIPPLPWGPVGFGESRSSSLGGGASGAGAWRLPGMTYEMQAAMETRWFRAPWHSHILGTHSLIHAADHRVWLPECWTGGAVSNRLGPRAP